MRLYTLFVTVCIVKSVYLEEQTNVGPTDDSALLNKNLSSSGNDLDEDLDDYMPVMDWSDTFDWQLLKAVLSREPRNVLISPLGLKLALVMLYEGSSGSTEKQFQSIMQLPTKSEARGKYKRILEALQKNTQDYELNIGTRMFLESSIQPNQLFSTIVKSAYDTDVYPTNYSDPAEASRTINAWVDALTDGHIKNLVNREDLSDDVLMVVANAIYFKGEWRRQFPKSKTHSGGFYVSPTELINVQYMSNTNKYYYGESKEFDAKLLRLPYKGQQFAMFLVLPNSKAGLPDLLKTINLKTLKRQLYLLDRKTVDVVIPKFRFDFASSYSKILEEFGLNIIFSNTASFPGIARGVGSGTKWLFVNDIKQKAGIEVNEEGSTVYAATDIELSNTFGAADISFNATHPFLLFVEDQTTGSILFAGKVVNPLDPVAIPSRFVESEEKVAPATPPPVFQSSFNLQNYFNEELLTGFDDSQNYFISPASIKATLGMVLESSRGHGAVEIMKAIGFSLDQSRKKLQSMLYDLNDNTHGTTVQSVNAAFLSKLYGIIPEYQQNIRRYYSADVHPIDFSNPSIASNTINSWVRTSTNGLIPAIVSPEIFNADTEFVLANALNFKGQWKFEFDERNTAIKCFHTLKHGCINAKMMQTVGQFKYKSFDEISAQAIQLPYGDGRYAMVVLLPKEKDAVEDLIKDLQHYSLPSILKTLELRDVLVNLPKFEIDYRGDIVPLLKKLGVKKIFNRNANLSGIAENGQVLVNNFIHKAKIEVNEKDTIAAAAPIIDMGSSMSRFMADRPFLFFIYHVTTSNILFEGRLNEVPEVYN